MSSHARASLRIALTVLALVVVAALAGLTGCAKKKAPDPYIPASYAAVAQGDTLKDHRQFYVPLPKFDFVHGNTGMVKIGKNLTFMVGKDLEQNYKSWTGSLIGVQRMSLPAPYLLVRKVKSATGIAPVDSVPSFGVPRLIPITQEMMTEPGANLEKLSWADDMGLQEYMPKPGQPSIKMQSQVEKFVHLPLHTLPSAQQAAATQYDYVWYIVLPNATFQVVALNSGADWMMSYLASQNKPLYGSFSIVSLDPYEQKQAEYGQLGHVVGKIKINWFRFGQSAVKGGLG
jgi:hypothetical protein